MPLPISRANGTLAAAQVPDGFSRAESKELSHLQNREVARGLVAGSRVQAAAMVTALGMQNTAMLSREAIHQADGDPAARNRLNYIVDQYASFVGNQVAQFNL